MNSPAFISLPLGPEHAQVSFFSCTCMTQLIASAVFIHIDYYRHLGEIWPSIRQSLYSLKAQVTLSRLLVEVNFLRVPAIFLLVLGARTKRCISAIRDVAPMRISAPAEKKCDDTGATAKHVAQGYHVNAQSDPCRKSSKFKLTQCRGLSISYQAYQVLNGPLR